MEYTLITIETKCSAPQSLELEEEEMHFENTMLWSSISGESVVIYCFCRVLQKPNNFMMCLTENNFSRPSEGK